MRFLDKTESVTDYNFDYLVEDTASTQNWPAFYKKGWVKSDLHAGRVNRELWFQNGVLHRDGAPARIDHNRTGQVRARQWYRYGHEIPPQRPVIPTAPTTPAAVFDTGVSL
ncbi:hypothetical protein HHJ73_09070 [Mobiluncus mulieris]|uniref:hypothetical protein n=1 Tax=Mobiluncus mulieris TaxID=2052 RepID=UPI00147033C3|nr:hypothetical protein [Mobiluncus mulieris]NMW81896.1 hypothetical protein [Mobiluncus mulieris]